MEHLPGHIAEKDIVLLLREQRKNHREILGYMLRPRIPRICVPNFKNLFRQRRSSTDNIICAGGCSDSKKDQFCLARKVSQGVQQRQAPLVVELPAEKPRICRQSEATLAYLVLQGKRTGAKVDHFLTKDSFWCISLLHFPKVRKIKLIDIPAHSTFCYARVVNWHQTPPREKETKVVVVLKLPVFFSILFSLLGSLFHLMLWIYFNLSKRDFKVIKIHLLKVTNLHCQICSYGGVSL